MVRPLRANYKRPPLKKKSQIPLRNFKIMKVPGHHLHDTQHHIPTKAPDIAPKKKSPAYRLNTILLCILKPHFQLSLLQSSI